MAKRSTKKPAPRRRATTHATATALAERNDLRRRVRAYAESRRLLRKIDAFGNDIAADLDAWLQRELSRRGLIAVSREEYDLSFGRVRELEASIAEVVGERDALRLDAQSATRQLNTVGP